MTPENTVSKFVDQARRRALTHLGLEQVTFALMVGMGGMVALMLAGTQILNWYWVVIVALASLAVGLYRIRGRIPSRYQIALQVDQQLKLTDTLSTAIHFGEDGSGVDAAVRQKQAEMAEELCSTLDPKLGIPMRRPRYAILSLALACAAAGLFLVRYAATGSMNLQPSLARIAYDEFFSPNPDLAKNSKKQAGRKPGDSSPEGADSQFLQDPNGAAMAGDEGQPSNTGDETATADSKKGGMNGEKPGEDGKNGGNNPTNDESKNGQGGDSSKAGQDSKQASDKQGENGSPQSGENSSSMMSKLRQAVQNMLSKSKPQDSQNGQKQASQKGEGDASKQAKADEQDTDDQDQSSVNAPSDSGAKKDSPSGQQSADAKGQGQSDHANSPKDQQSGAGSAEGDKAAKQAAQLAAMGKLAEVMGKRSQQVSGEMIVETGAPRQQLKTALEQKQAQHGEAGGAIHRDEVPLAYEQYVEQYFDAIRKAPAAAPAAPAVKPAK